MPLTWKGRLGFFIGFVLGLIGSRSPALFVKRPSPQPAATPMREKI
jgi:hypothetical protein